VAQDEPEPDPGSAMRSHREVLRAIRSGDPELARKVAQKHIRKNCLESNQASARLACTRPVRMLWESPRVDTTMAFGS